MPLFVWNDVSPDDGCTLVRFALMAGSASEVADAAARIPTAQNRTVPKLLKRAGLRPSAEDDCPAVTTPGRVFWQDDAGRWYGLG